jgi:ABC-2 type transport system permease protein
MTDNQGMLAGINQLTMNWASPITVDPQDNKERKVSELLHSSSRSWTSDSLNIQPDFQQYGPMGFKPGHDLEPRLVGVMVEGSFSSWFSNRPSPLLTEKKEDNADTKQPAKDKKGDEEKLVIGRVIDHSPESARLVLFSSNTFLSDTSLGIIASVMNTGYDAPVRLINNVVDWSLEDRALLAIRGRGQFARTLMPLSRNTRVFWEYLNYGLVLAGLLLIKVLRLITRKRTRISYQHILTPGEEAA